MIKPRLTSEEIKRRKEWKCLFKEISIRGRRRTSKEIANEMDNILKNYDCFEYLGEISPATINLYRSIPKNLEEGSKIDLRIPKNKYIANALIQALDSLGAWKDIDEKSKECEKYRLLDLIGIEKTDMWINCSPRHNFKNIQEAKEYSSKLLYDVILDSLNSTYKNQNLTGRVEIIGHLEKIIDKYKDTRD